MEAFQTFWGWAYVIGIGLFAAVAVVIVPLGFRDVLQLLRELSDEVNSGD